MNDNLVLRIGVGISHAEQFLSGLILFVLCIRCYLGPLLLCIVVESLPDLMADFMEDGIFTSVVPRPRNGDCVLCVVDAAYVFIIPLEGVACLENPFVAFHQGCMCFGDFAECSLDVVSFFGDFDKMPESHIAI